MASGFGAGRPITGFSLALRPMEHLRDELIQVAAVAVAIIQDLDEGTTGGGYLPTDIAWAIRNERQRQEEKWGPQHHGLGEWMTILMEEVGEAAKAALDEVIFPVGPVGGDE